MSRKLALALGSLLIIPGCLSTPPEAEPTRPIGEEPATPQFAVSLPAADHAIIETNLAEPSCEGYVAPTAPLEGGLVFSHAAQRTSDGAALVYECDLPVQNSQALVLISARDGDKWRQFSGVLAPGPDEIIEDLNVTSSGSTLSFRARPVVPVPSTLAYAVNIEAAVCIAYVVSEGGRYCNVTRLERNVDGTYTADFPITTWHPHPEPQEPISDFVALLSILAVDSLGKREATPLMEVLGGACADGGCGVRVE